MCKYPVGDGAKRTRAGEVLDVLTALNATP
jgi:hypothetical protein